MAATIGRYHSLATIEAELVSAEEDTYRSRATPSAVPDSRATSLRIDSTPWRSRGSDKWLR